MRLSTFILIVMLISLMIVALLVGQQSLIISIPLSESMYTLITHVRIPRILGAVVIGAGLSTAGAAYQAAFKNPIVSPSILGVTAGAGIGASLCMLTRNPEYISIASIVCGCLTVFLVWQIARILSTENAHLLVIGVIVSGVASSALALIKFIGDPNGILPAITYWLMGSLTTIRLTDSWVLLVIIIINYLFYRCRWRLDILNQSSIIVRSLGINERYNISVIVLGATIIAAFASSISGIIGMIGLAIPHLIRMLQGTDEYRVTLLHMQLTGSIFLLAVDTIVRVLPVELPVGILTSLFGAIIFGIALCNRLRHNLK